MDMPRFNPGRAAMLAAFIFLVLHVFLILDLLFTFTAAADHDVPLLISAEVGVVSFGHWAWLTLPLALQSIFFTLNFFIAQKSSNTKQREALMVLNAFTGLLFFLGSLSTAGANLPLVGPV